MLRKIGSVLVAIISALFVWNTSLFTAPITVDGPHLIAHRGVHQQYDRTDLGMSDCTAARWIDTGHSFQENTLTSIEAAFALGAKVVEIDIHQTIDDRFVVFHDRTIDCRTEGNGEVTDHDLTYLQSLDIAYGYTAPDGSHPFRDDGVGLMPSLTEVLRAFPDGLFLINIKSGASRHGEAFVSLIRNNPEWVSQIWGVYGGHKPSKLAAEQLGNLRWYSRQTTKACLKDYAILGWTGHVPEACQTGIVAVPHNYARFLWGWPRKFEQRMTNSGSTVILLGDHQSGNSGSRGIDTPDQFARVPNGFGGLVWTNRIEVIAKDAD